MACDAHTLHFFLLDSDSDPDPDPDPDKVRRLPPPGRPPLDTRILRGVTNGLIVSPVRVLASIRSQVGLLPK